MYGQLNVDVGAPNNLYLPYPLKHPPGPALIIMRSLHDRKGRGSQQHQCCPAPRRSH